MSRFRIAATECNCKQVDRQLKEKFIHELTDKEMLAEIISELTKSNENTMIHSE